MIAGLPWPVKMLMSCGVQELSQLPPNDVTAEYVDAMAAAVQEYGQPDAIVLFVVQPGEKNSFDQQVLCCTVLCCAVLCCAGLGWAVLWLTCVAALNCLHGSVCGKLLTIFGCGLGSVFRESLTVYTAAL